MEPFLSTICEICGKPTFLCVCVIDSLQKCRGKSENGVVYTNISVSTMTVCFNFNNEINLKVVNFKGRKLSIIVSAFSSAWSKFFTR